MEITADGFKKDDISIEIKDNVLVLSAHKTEKPTTFTAVETPAVTTATAPEAAIISSPSESESNGSLLDQLRSAGQNSESIFDDDTVSSTSHRRRQSRAAAAAAAAAANFLL